MRTRRHSHQRLYDWRADGCHCQETGTVRKLSAPGLEQRDLPCRRCALKNRPVWLTCILSRGLQAGQRAAVMTARFRASAGSLPQCQERGSVHPSRDGERHLWTFVGYKRSQSIICNLYIARNGFRNLGGIICKSHCNLYPSHFATPQYFEGSGSLVILTHLL